MAAPCPPLDQGGVTDQLGLFPHEGMEAAQGVLPVVAVPAPCGWTIMGIHCAVTTS